MMYFLCGTQKQPQFFNCCSTDLVSFRSNGQIIRYCKIKHNLSQFEGNVFKIFCFFSHSLASNLQLTFTGFFHKAGEFVPWQLSLVFFMYYSSSTDSGSLLSWFVLWCFQESCLRTVRMSRTLCLWRCCWSKSVTRRGRCVFMWWSSRAFSSLRLWWFWSLKEEPLLLFPHWSTCELSFVCV